MAGRLADFLTTILVVVYICVMHVPCPINNTSNMGSISEQPYVFFISTSTSHLLVTLTSTQGFEVAPANGTCKLTRQCQVPFLAQMATGLLPKHVASTCETH